MLDRAATKNSTMWWLIVITLIANMLFMAFPVVSSSGLITIVSLLALMTIGLWHGCFDLQIYLGDDRQFYKRSGRVYIYLTVFAACAFFAYIFPKVALLLFLMLSAYHFGQQQLSSFISDKTGDKIMALSCGIFILAGLFYCNGEQLDQITSALYGQTIDPALPFITLLFSGATFLILTIYDLLTKGSGNLNYWLVQYLALTLLFMFFKCADILIGFTFYFILWHSLPSVKDQITHNYGRVDRLTLKRFLVESFPIWILTIMGIAVLYFFIPNINQLIPLLLALAIGVTVPHSFIINQMESSSP